MYLAMTGTVNDLMPKYRYIILEDNVVSVPLKFFVNKPIETSVTKHRTLVIKKKIPLTNFCEIIFQYTCLLSKICVLLKTNASSFFHHVSVILKFSDIENNLIQYLYFVGSVQCWPCS